MKKLLIISVLLGETLIQAASPSRQEIIDNIAYNQNTLNQLTKFVNTNQNSNDQNTRKTIVTLSKRIRELPQEIQYLEHKLLLHPDSTQKITDNDLTAARSNVLNAPTDERTKYETILNGLIAKKMQQDGTTPRTSTIDSTQQAINQQLAALRDQNRPRVERTDILEILDGYRIANLTDANPRNIDPRGIAQAWANPAFEFNLPFALDENEKAKIKNYIQTNQSRNNFLNPLIALADLKQTTVEDILIWYLIDAANNDPLYNPDAPLETSRETTRNIITKYAIAHPAKNHPGRPQYATEVKFDEAISKLPTPSSNTPSATSSTRPSITTSDSASAAAVCTPEETAFLKSLATDKDAVNILSNYYYLPGKSAQIKFYCNNMQYASNAEWRNNPNNFTLNFNNLDLTNEQKEKIKGYIIRTGNVYLPKLMTLAFIKNTTVEAILANYLKNEPTRRLDYTETFAEGRMNNDIIKEYCQKKPITRTDTVLRAIEERLNAIYRIDPTKPAPSASTSSSVTAATTASMTASRPSSIPSSSYSSSSAISSSATASGVMPSTRPAIVTPVAPIRPAPVVAPRQPQPTVQPAPRPVVVPTPPAIVRPSTPPAVRPTSSATSSSTPAPAASAPANISHPIFTQLDMYKQYMTDQGKSITVASPMTHAYTWDFSKLKHLPELARPTVAQVDLITAYITNLSPRDYAYFTWFADVKKTTVEYILTSYCQTHADDLQTITPVTTILAWYLDTYPARVQSSRATIQIENDLHASTQTSIISTTVNWLKSWWS